MNLKISLLTSTILYSVAVYFSGFLLLLHHGDISVAESTAGKERRASLVRLASRVVEKVKWPALKTKRP
jgi:hypothetical protein